MTGISTEFRNTCLYGFTLAEILICLVVLGIIASLTIPSVIQKQREAANRTKIKKSMTVYDNMFTKMTVENNLKSDQAVRDFVKADCSNTASYFKIAEKISTENSCTFQTSDGVFWNIEDIFHPVISLKKDDLDDLTSKNTFQMVTTFDPKSGAFRTDDFAYVQTVGTDEEKEEIAKLFAFVKLGVAGTGVVSGDENSPYDVDKEIENSMKTFCDGEPYISCRSGTAPFFLYDRNGNLVATGACSDYSDNDGSKCIEGSEHITKRYEYDFNLTASEKALGFDMKLDGVYYKKGQLDPQLYTTENFCSDGDDISGIIRNDNSRNQCEALGYYCEYNDFFGSIYCTK